MNDVSLHGSKDSCPRVIVYQLMAFLQALALAAIFGSLCIP